MKKTPHQHDIRGVNASLPILKAEDSSMFGTDETVHPGRVDGHGYVMRWIKGEQWQSY